MYTLIRKSLRALERKVKEMKIYAKTLVKVDKNNSKHYTGIVECDRCGGRGWYAVGVHNGQLVPSHVDNAVCYKCHGAGKVQSKWIERTAEYQAKLDARRQEKLEAEKARIDAERKEREEAERIAKEAKEAEEAARKTISNHIGAVGDKLNIKVRFDHTAWYERKSFAGYGMETVYIVSFRDESGNLLIWKTTSPKGCAELEEGDEISLKGTIKEHTEYRDEKQTILTRCKVTR